MFESSNPISAGSMMSLAICCDLVGGLTWPRERCESTCCPTQWQVKIYQDPLLKTVIAINSPGGGRYWVEEHHKMYYRYCIFMISKYIEVLLMFVNPTPPPDMYEAL